jgi:hypothetical protein
MSEYIHYTEDGEPYFPFGSNRGDMIATPDNSSIFRHTFEDRGADHLFIGFAEDGENVRGAFVFRAEMELVKPGFFETLLNEMQQHDWDIIECDQLADGDRKVFDNFVDRQVEKVTNKKIKRWVNAGK